MTRRSALYADIQNEISEYSLTIVKHPDFPRLLSNFIRDCDDLDDEMTVEREERRERRNQF